MSYWKEAPCSGGLLKSCLLCQCSHLLPDWRLCLASAGAGSPVECCRLPPAGAQRSWLSSPSPPPPSRSPLTGSPEDTTAPSSHLWKRDAMGNILVIASDFSVRSSTVCCTVRWKAPHKNATWFETLKGRQRGTKLMNPRSTPACTSQIIDGMCVLLPLGRCRNLIDEFFMQTKKFWTADTVRIIHSFKN